MAELRKVSAAACDDPQRMADVVFIHGLGGDASGTWRYGEGNDTSWPHWLAQDFPQVGVWSLDYAASKWKPGRFLKWFFSGLSAKLGHSMPLPKRANDVLRTLMLNGFGERPVVLICHSLGGLIAKEVLRQSHRETASPALKAISANTRAVLFLATPHRGATLASRIDLFRKVLGTTVTISDLKAFDSHLLELLGWYSGYADGKIETVSYCEERGVGELLRIVDEFSANPEVGVVVSADEDHLSIAKPKNSKCNSFMESIRILRGVIWSLEEEEKKSRERLLPPVSGEFGHYREKCCQELIGRIEGMELTLSKILSVLSKGHRL